jgi:hypothetical protein
MKQQAEAEERGANRAHVKLLEKLRFHERSPPSIAQLPPEKKPNVDIEAPGSGPENAIAPEGTRDT